MSDEQHSPSAISKSRLEVLVDGIFAIAMTILVLDLRVPELADRHSIRELGRALVAQRTTYVSYLLSFLMLGMFWYRQNHTYRYFRVITKPMLALYFAQLAVAASFPFCASLFGRYVGNPMSIAIYLGCVMLYAWIAAVTWVVARRSGSLNADVTDAIYLRSRRRWAFSCAFVTLLFVLNLSRVIGGIEPGGPGADEQAIRDLASRWQKALLDRDAAGQAAMFAADGIEYHDGQEPLVGPAQVLAWEQKAASDHPKAKITTTTDRILISASGDLAVQSGEGRITALGARGEDTSVRRQRFVTVWKKVDGRWKVAHDIAVNTTPW